MEKWWVTGRFCVFRNGCFLSSGGLTFFCWVLYQAQLLFQFSSVALNCCIRCYLVSNNDEISISLPRGRYNFEHNILRWSSIFCMKKLTAMHEGCLWIVFGLRILSWPCTSKSTCFTQLRNHFFYTAVTSANSLFTVRNIRTQWQVHCMAVIYEIGGSCTSNYKACGLSNQLLCTSQRYNYQCQERRWEGKWTLFSLCL